MANIVKILWSKITGRVPESLFDGQIAINQKDKKLFYPNENGVVQSFDLAIVNPVRIIANDGIKGANVTGTVSETILFSQLIPANTFKDGDFINLLTRIGRFAPTASSGGINQRIRINTSNTLTGANQIATSILTAGVNGNQFGVLIRTFQVTNSFLVGIAGFGSSPNDFSNTNAAVQSTVFNPTVDNYIFLTGQLGTAIDTMYHLATKITN